MHIDDNRKVMTVGLLSNHHTPSNAKNVRNDNRKSGRASLSLNVISNIKYQISNQIKSVYDLGS